MTDTRIIALRRERGWTQERLAAESGVGVRTIQRLEAGDEASLETLRLVAGALGVEVRELFPADEPASATPGRRRWVAIVSGLALVGVIGGAAAGLLQPTQSEATVRAQVAVVARATLMPAPSQYRQQIVDSISSVATTPLVLQEADRHLAAPIGERALAEAVRSRVLPGTSQIVVTARAGTGAAALERANAVLDALIDEVPLLSPTAGSTQLRVTRVGRPETNDPRAVLLLRDGGIGLGGGLLVGALVVAGARRREGAEAVGRVAVA